MKINYENVSLKDAVKGFRPQVLTHIKNGVNLLSKISPPGVELIVKESREAIVSSLGVDEESIAKELNITVEDSISLLSAATFLTYILSSGKYTVDSFINEAIEAGLATSENRQGLDQFIMAVINEQPEVRDELEQISLASSVLPTLQSFQLAVDLRLKFDGDEIKTATPVTIAHFDTDGESQVIWFQMTAIQVEKLIIELEKSLKRMRVADSKFSDCGKK